MDKLAVTQRFWAEVPPARPLKEVMPVLSITSGLGWVAGSYAAWMANPDENAPLPNDIDVFAASDNGAELIAVKMRKKFDCMTSDNGMVITCEYRYKRKPVQVIRPHPDWKKFPDDILHSFDFTACRALMLDHKSILVDYDWQDTDARILRIADPVKTMQRVIKYAQRGVKFDAWELLKILRAWSEMSEERREAIYNRIADERFPSDGPGENYPYVDEDDYWDAE